MSNKVTAYVSDKLQRGEPITTNLYWKITAAKTVEDLAANAALVTFDALSAQSVIDNFLGSTNEFLLTGFSSTAMGTDAIGMVVDMGGQLSKLESISLILRSGTSFATVAEKTLWSDATALPNTLTDNVQVSSAGNIAFHAVMTGIDALTAGQIELKIVWRAK